MRSGFEDWDFFLSMLETTPEAFAGIEAISNSRLFGWKNEIIHSIKNSQELSDSANDLLKIPRMATVEWLQQLGSYQLISRYTISVITMRNTLREFLKLSRQSPRSRASTDFGSLLA